MRSLVRSMLVLFVLVISASPLAAPATTAPGGARPDARIASRAVVHGSDMTTSQRRPTSFEVFSQRGRAAGGGLWSARPVPEARAPLSVFGFDAQGPNLEDAKPSDTIGALGDTFFVTAVNVRVAVYDRLGVEVVPPTLLDSLHPDSVGRFAFDPKVIYDQYSDTFVLVYLVQEDFPRLSRIIAVTIPNATATDVGTWCATSFPGDAVAGPPAIWADYPGLGYDQERVTITSNQFTFPSSQGQFRHAQVMSIPKGPLYDCTQPEPTPDVFTGTQTRDANGIQAFTLQPAQTMGTANSSQLLLSVQLAGRSSYLALWRIKETATGVTLKKGIITIGKTTLPPFGTQGGAGINNSDLWWDVGDERLISTFFDADRNELFAAHAVAKNFKPDPVTGGYLESAVRWYEVNPAARLKNSTLARKGTVGAPEVDVGWPSVATDASGSLFIAYSRAGAPANEFLSAWVAEVEPNGTAATQLLLAAGLDTYDASGGPERWGDYTGINRDPVDPAFVATFNQYALDGSTWQQVVNVVAHS